MTAFFLHKPLRDLHYSGPSAPWSIQAPKPTVNSARDTDQEGITEDGRITTGSLALTFPKPVLEPIPDNAHENELDVLYHYDFELKLEPKPPKPGSALEQCLEDLHSLLGDLLDFFFFTPGADGQIHVTNAHPLSQEQYATFIPQLEKILGEPTPTPQASPSSKPTETTSPSHGLPRLTMKR